MPGSFSRRTAALCNPMATPDDKIISSTRRRLGRESGAKAEAAKKDGKNPPKFATTLEADVETLKSEKAKGRPVEAKLEAELDNRLKWWTTEGLPNYEKDWKPLETAREYGAKHALLYTAGIPAALAIGFLLLIIYFALAGGYKQVHLEEEPPMGEY